MSEVKYFKHYAESELGEGVALFEAVGDVFVRQVEIYGDQYVWSDEHGQSDDRFMLADRLLSEAGLDASHEISAEEFNEAWTTAKERA